MIVTTTIKNKYDIFIEDMSFDEAKELYDILNNNVSIEKNEQLVSHLRCVVDGV